jgi:hypothetical protein
VSSVEDDDVGLSSSVVRGSLDSRTRRRALVAGLSSRGAMLGRRNPPTRAGDGVGSATGRAAKAGFAAAGFASSSSGGAETGTGSAGDDSTASFAVASSDTARL